MSSKSRKHSSPPRRANRPAEEEVPGAAEAHESVQVAGVELGDDVVIVPKDRNPMFFLLMIALLIFLLVIFIVPGAMLGAAGGGGGGQQEGIPDYLSLELPTVDGGTRTLELDQGSFVRRRITIDRVLQFDPFMLLDLGVFGSTRTGLEEEDHARLVALDALAEEAGVVVPPEDLGEHLKAVLVNQGFTGPDQYKATFLSDRDGITPAEFEEEMANMLRVRRFASMLGEIPRLPDPGWIESTWADEHVDERFQYVSLEVASLEDEVRTEGIDDEGLQAWFDGLDEFRRQQYRTEEQRVVTLAHVGDLEGFDAAALLERYPAEEGTDPEAQANEYYNQVFLDRFLYDPSEEQAGPENPDQAVDSTKQFRDFDEVADIARREAPIFFALQTWSNDLLDRELAGEEVDFAAEATALGIPLSTSEPLTRTELVERETLGGDVLADAAWRTNAGGIGSTLIVTETDFALVAVDEVVEAEVPPVTEIREEVLEEWVTAEAQDRALARLNALRDGFAERVAPEVDEDDDETEVQPPLTNADGDEVARREADADAFRTAAEAAGLTVEVREWLDRRGRLTDDPDSDDPAHRTIRSNREAANAGVGEVLLPGLDTAREIALLVRKDGEREVPLSRMSPQDYASYKARSVGSAPREIRNAMDFAFLQEQYGLRLYSPEDSRAEAEGAEGGTEETAGAETE